MRLLCKIPDEIWNILSKHENIGRKELAKLAGVSDYEARNYLAMWTKGKTIHYDENKALIEPAESKSAIILPDLHFPYHDEQALDTAINYILKQPKYDYLILLGDVADNYSISSWKKDPQRANFETERDQVVEHVKELTTYFPSTKRYWLEGNHELRLRNMIWTRVPELAGLQELDITQVYHMRDLGFTYVSNTDLLRNAMPVFRLGKLYVIHGHEVYRGSGGLLRQPARMVYFRSFVSVIAGHWHQQDKHTNRKLDQHFDGCWITGCLCELNPLWNPVNSWAHGIAEVHWDKAFFSVRNLQIIEGRVLGS